MISQQHSFVFIHVPKTGGNSIQLALAPFADDRIVESRSHHDGRNRFELEHPALGTHKHSTLGDYFRKLERGAFDRLRVISGTRNPWDRFVSFFFSPHRGNVAWSPESFESFLGQMHPAAYYLECPASADPFGRVDRFIRFDHLEADFRRVCELLGIGPLELPRVNLGSPRRSYRDYYHGGTQRLVRELCRDEIRRFGYEF